MKKKIVQVSRGEQPDICSEKGEGLPSEAMNQRIKYGEYV